MNMAFKSFAPRLAALALLAGGPSACNTLDRLSSIGAEPPVTPIQNPAIAQPPVTMPTPAPVALERQANSLWTTGARAFFKDQRASQIGDILTVTINIADNAQLSNSTERTRTNTEGANAANLLGYENRIFDHLPGTNKSDPTKLINLGSNSDSKGTGTINRTETIALRVAVTVTQVLTNGNLVVQGSQEVRVNFENRVLQIAGVIRPQDIRSDNQIPYDRIAEARIAYGGRGQLTDVQQPRWGQQVYDILFPF